MVVERREVREETRETRLPPSDLFKIWPVKILHLERALTSTASIDGLVDVVRSCNLRSKHAASRRQEGGPFSVFHDRWSELKYQALLKAVEMRKAGVVGIRIGFDMREPEGPRFCERLVFVFETKPTYYRTETALGNLARLMPKEQLMGLLLSFDYV